MIKDKEAMEFFNSLFKIFSEDGFGTWETNPRIVKLVEAHDSRLTEQVRAEVVDKIEEKMFVEKKNLNRIIITRKNWILLKSHLKK